MEEYLNKSKSELEQELARYRSHYEALETKRSQLERQRGEHAKVILRYLFPDMSKKSILQLKQDVPGFKQLPIVYKWFGLSWDVDRRADMNMVRIRLGHYLDTLTDESKMPKEWRDQVYSLDKQLGQLQKTEMVRLGSKIQDLTQKIAAVEKLQKVGPRMPLRQKMLINEQARQDAHRYERDNDSGPSFFTIWLLHELMNSGSDTSMGMSRSENIPGMREGEGEFSGGGADVATGFMASSSKDDIDHVSLGSQKFS